MEIPENMDDALKIAVDNEIKGREIYLKFSEKAVNDVTKKVFKFIADQELLHIGKIKELVELGGGRFDGFNYDSNARKLTEHGLKELFGVSVKGDIEKITASTDDIQAYEMGIEMEENAFNLYTELSKKVKNEKVKMFFDLLSKEESNHHELLKKALDFIKNPQAWYADNEGWLLEG